LKILLQNQRTRLFYKDLETWVKTHHEAWDFKTVADAIEHYIQKQIKGVRVIVKFEYEKYDIAIPLKRRG
jgi:hypothetical protein